jgi:hypothetical protein
MQETDIALRRDGARRNWKFSVEVAGMGDPPDVPKLQKDAPPGCVYRLDDIVPAFDLLVRPNPGSAWVADALRRNRGRLAQDKPGTGPLGIVYCH